MTTNKRKYLFWVENEEYAKEGFGKMLSLGSHEILGPISNQTEAVQVFKQYQDEIMIALIDLWIPENDGDTDEDPETGYKVAKLIKNSGIPVILLTVEPVEEILLDAIQNQISLLVKRDMKDHVIVQALEMAMAGCGIYSRQAFGELARLINQETSENPLAEEQWMLLESRISGESIRQIADKTGYAVSTISNRFTDIYQKIGVPNQLEAIRWYQKNAKIFGRNTEY